MKKLLLALTLLVSLVLVESVSAQTQFTTAQRNAILLMIQEYLTNGNTFGGGGAGNPAGSTGWVQYNSAGAFGAEAAFSYNAATDTLSATNFTGALLGNATTASALFANPAACAANRYVTDTAANGDLTCAQVSLASGVTGNLPVANLNNGTAADNTTFWRGDGTWAVPAGGGGGAGDVTEVQGTANEIAISSGTGPIPVVGLAASIDFTGKALRLPLSSDPGSPATGQIWVNGANLKFRDNDGSPATKTVLTAETQTLDTVADLNPKTTGRTCSSPFEIEGNTANTLVRICDDPTLGLYVDFVVGGVLGAVNKRIYLNSGFDYCIAQRPTQTCLFTIDYTNGITRLVPGTQAQGDIIYFNGTSWVRLAPGTSGQTLTTQGAAANPIWSGGDISTRVSHNATQSIPDSAETVAAFNAEQFDTAAFHDNTTNNSRLFFVTAGKYLVGGNIDFVANGTGTRYACLRLNATTALVCETRTAVTTAGTGTRVGLQTLYSFAASDYIEMIVFQDSGGALNLGTDTSQYPIMWAVKQ